ncbi:MAG TPA: hypothetical protein VMW58_14415 [Anaerolineae bacterium]|nr:hypothetical protein [Anaerolineae bacterium]
MRWRNADLGYVSMIKLATEGHTGRRWYQDSKASIDAYAMRHGLDAGVVCDTLAILSPRVTVERGVRLAHAWLTTGRADKAMRHRVKALESYAHSGTFGGPKVNAFAMALRGDPHAIVIDAWMYRAARIDKPGVKAYRHVESMVQDAASVLGWPYRETQATIWQGARAYVGYASGYRPLSMDGF